MHRSVSSSSQLSLPPATRRERTDVSSVLSIEFEIWLLVQTQNTTRQPSRDHVRRVNVNRQRLDELVSR